MLPTNLTGHFIDRVGIRHTQLVTNVKQVGKVTPTFDATAIFDQIAQHRRLCDIVFKFQAAGSHDIDDVTESPLKASSLVDVTPPKQAY